jgi:hypothetical protein
MVSRGASRSAAVALTALCICTTWATTCCSESDDEPKRAPAATRLIQVSARLEVENAPIALGDKVEFTVTIQNRSNASVSLLNPFFDKGVPVRTVDLVVLDENGVTTGEIFRLARQSGSYVKLEEDAFFKLPPNGVVGKRDSAKLSIIRRQTEQIRRGKYRVQMIFRDWFVSEYPYSGLPLQPWDPAARMISSTSSGPRGGRKTTWAKSSSEATSWKLK